MSQEESQYWAMVAAWATVGVAFVAAILAYRQLKRMADASTIQSIQMILQMNASINEAKLKLSQYADEVVKAAAQHQNCGNVTSVEAVALAKKRDIALQDYLNALDTLCACFVRRSLKEQHYRSDYETMVKQAVEKYPKFFTGQEKRFSNVAAIYDKWVKNKNDGCLSGLVLHILLSCFPLLS